MSTSRRLLNCLALLAAGALVAAAPALASPIACNVPGNIVVNCGFESGTSPWVLSGDLAYFGTDIYHIHSGTVSMHMGSTTSTLATGNHLSQDLVTTPGATYSLSFWLANTDDSGPAASFEAFWNGSAIAASLMTAGDTSFSEYTFAGLTAGSGDTTLEFEAYSLHGYYYLDDVSVVQSQASPVPEPASALLLLTGALLLAGLAVSRRRWAAVYGSRS